MISIVLMLILWTWNLTPLWVNIIGTILLLIRVLIKFGALFEKISDDSEENYNG